MGASISIYSKAVQENCEKHSEDPYAFLESQENLIPFSEDQIKLIEEHLNKRGYRYLRTEQPIGEVPIRRAYEFEDNSLGIEVFLTQNGLHFSSPNGEGVFEITMTGSEFGSSLDYDPLAKQFSVFDPLQGGWVD
ncbi:MAG: hypothetical protein MRY83_19005 [Flavobacteriales bacterium]|nr:hypothetical protein [Flavobacteriales bacterium]